MDEQTCASQTRGPTSLTPALTLNRPMALLHELAEFAVAQTRSPPASGVMHHAKRALLDWLAALYPGTRCAPTVQLLAAYADELGVGRSSVIGAGTTAFAATAAWINGTASHAVELDDIYREAVYHPGSPTVAAALAVAERQGASGQALLSAIVVGYEIATRVGAALQPSHSRRFHATGTLGCLGAAASAAVLLSPEDATMVRHALATATTFASGLQQALRSGSMSKPLHAGHAAAVGVRAAQAARHGVTGTADMLEGAFGMGAVMADGADWTRATQGLGEVWHITQITHKVHACCGHVFAAIDAALALRAAHAIDPERIVGIQVSTYHDAIVATGRYDPQTAYEAKFSLPYVVCHALVHGSVNLDAFDADRVADAQLRQLMRCCTLDADAEASAAFPSRRMARVTLTSADGQRFSHLARHRRGDPESPLSDADLDAKFIALSSPVIGAARAQQLRDRVWQLDTLELEALQLAAPTAT